MPSIDFKGKSFIYTHHLGVPYRELLVDTGKSCPAEGKQPDLDDNLILHGDNLEALKALLPRYAGRVDCIYIDPPYNTGNEGWCYNDAVNAPLMREWLKKAANPVERDDLQRHDKWLCMMWPRLQLLKELLSESGAIFVSIDDNEVHRLRDMMDEVFGEDAFVATIVWQKRYSRENRGGIGDAHEYVLVYAHDAGSFKDRRNLQTPTDEQMKVYSQKGENGDTWRGIPMTAQGFRKNQMYKITTESGVVHTPPEGRCWSMTEPEFEKLRAAGRIYFGKRGDAQPSVIRYASEVPGFVPWTWWPSNESGHTDSALKEIYEIMGRSEGFQTPKPSKLICRLLEIATKKDSLILDSFAGSGTTGHAVLSLNAKDGGNRRFILVQCDEYDKEKKEPIDLCNTLTAERVRRVIRGYDYTGTHETELHPPEQVTWTTFARDKSRNEILERIEGIEALERANYDKIERKITDGVLTIVGQKHVKEKMAGLGGSFTYLELGEAMDLERLLAETPGTLPTFPALARYLFFTATGHTLPATEPPATPKSAARGKGRVRAKPAPESVPTADPFLIGETAVWRIYLHYRPDEAWLRSPAAAFTRTQAETISVACKDTGKQALVFAAAKFINHRSLRELRVDFAQLPYALHRVQAE
jgi:adenine-specific DNA-methyltransferase